MRVWLMVGGLALMGALAGAALVWRQASADYRSEALLCPSPVGVPTALVRPIQYLPSEAVNGMAAVVMSRTALAKLIDGLNLYPFELQRKPLEDVIEDMKQSTRFALKERCVEVSFSHPDREKAQKALQALVSLVLETEPRWRGARAVATEVALGDLLEDAAAFMENRSQRARPQARLELTMKDHAPALELREEKPSPATPARTASDAEFARRRYAAMRARLSEFKMARRLAEKPYGGALMVVDAASLPDARWEKENGPWPMVLGAGAGAAVASLLVLAARRWVFARAV